MAARPSPQLLAEIEQTQALVRRSDEMSRVLEAVAAGGKGGFSEYLMALARQIPEGLWLTGIDIAAGGSDVEIRGSLIDTAALPEYIQRLGTERTFRGRNFAALSLNQSGPPTVKPVNSAATVAINLALQQGTASAELTEKLTARPGAFVGIPPSRTATGELTGVMSFVLVPQRERPAVARENKEAKS